MATYFYHYFYDEDVKFAESQLKFYESKILKIENEDINESNKLMKKKRIQFVIDCIKYSYGL